jgi:hypothetical protein
MEAGLFFFEWKLYSVDVVICENTLIFAPSMIARVLKLVDRHV